MNKTLSGLVYFIIAVTAVLILLFARFDLKIVFNSATIITFTTAAISLLIIGLIVYACVRSLRREAAQSGSEEVNPLGLPGGSVRAVVAIAVLVFFILLSLIFYFSSPNDELAKNILTTLGTLVIAVSAFYFGSKATEQGSKIASDAFSKAASAQSGNTTDNVPVEIIELALKTNGNKQAWIDKYQCQDVKAGKKIIGGTTNNVNCLVFITDKGTLPPKAESIPGIIPFSSEGKTYNIPTDVQPPGDGEKNTSSADNTTSAKPDDTTTELPAETNAEQKLKDSE